MTRATKGFGRLIRLAHAAVARDLAYVLTLAERDAWRGFATVLRARLSPDERAELARAALEALEWQSLGQIVAALRDDGAGPPVPAFDDLAEEARQWADWASPAEIRSFAVASFLRMTPGERRDFLAFGRGRAAA
jgi:hypothetical protein